MPVAVASVLGWLRNVISLRKMVIQPNSVACENPIYLQVNVMCFGIKVATHDRNRQLILS